MSQSIDPKCAGSRRPWARELGRRYCPVCDRGWMSIAQETGKSGLGSFIPTHRVGAA